MKRVFLSIFFLMAALTAFSQRFAYVDTKYVLNNIPAYKAAQEKLNQLSYEWEQELEAKQEKIDELEQEFQNEKVLLTDKMKEKRQEEIKQKKKELNDLKNKYFGPEGELYNKRQELVKPIQEEVYSTIQKIADDGNYAVIFDASDKSNILYTDPKYDKSDEVLKELGYKK
jgi:outer membrane protein